MATPGEQVAHCSVVGAHPGNQALNTPKASGGDPRRQQQRPHAVVLHAVVDGHGNLLGPSAQRLEDEVTDDPASGHGDESIAALVIGGGELIGLLVADAPRSAVESRRAAVGRELRVEPLELGRVAGRNPAHTDVMAIHAPIVAPHQRWWECRASLHDGPSGPVESALQVEIPGGSLQVVAEGGVRDRDQRVRAFGQ